MKRVRFFCLYLASCLCLLLGCCSPAVGQREYFNWYFGARTGITFNTSPPNGLADGQQDFPYGIGCVSDSSGRFLLASDGQRVWNQQWQQLPGLVSPHTLVGFSSRQVLVVRQPGSRNRYYVFRSSNQYVNSQLPIGRTSTGWFPYVVVDISGRGGLGAIVANDSLELPPGTNHASFPYYYLNANWVAIRHANGRDLWITGQTTAGCYVSYLLGPTGLGPAVSSVAPRDIYSPSDGILRASTDGKTLASTIYSFTRNTATTEIEIAQFNPATGRVTSYVGIPSLFRGRIINGPGSQFSADMVRIAGLELSPDGSRLYADTTRGSGVFQYNLLAGSPAAVAASRVTLQAEIQNNRGQSDSGDLQLGPDGNIYVIRASFQGAGRIERANALAPFCRFVADGVGYRRGFAPARYTFPPTTNDLGLSPVDIAAGGTINGIIACAGMPIPFSSSLSPFVSAAAFAWDFGDTASGARNVASGQAPMHTYGQPGNYTVTLQLTARDGRQFTTQLRVSVEAVPKVELGADSLICAGTTRLLQTGPQPTGTIYRWQDGRNSAEYAATKPGVYAVEVTNLAGCRTMASIKLLATDCPNLPNIITPNGDDFNQYFMLRGLNAPDWTLHMYNRWGRKIYSQQQYDNTWDAIGQPDGVYYYLLTNTKTGQKIKGWVEVRR